MRLGDAACPLLPNEPKYDFSYTFMLLHELPDNYKRNTVTSILSSVKPDGKAMFVDYHRPNNVFLRWYLWSIFQTFEPFGFQMFKENIKTFADTSVAAEFEWSKSTVFHEMFQIVTAHRKK